MDAIKKLVGGKKSRTGLALSQVQSEETLPLRDRGKKPAAGVAVTRDQVSLAAIKFNLKNNVTMAEIKDAEQREPASPRIYSKRIDQLTNLMAIVKKNKGTFLNNDLDTVFDIETYNLKDAKLRRVKSMEDFKSCTHNLLNECMSDHPSLTIASRADTFPYITIEEEEVRERFKEYT